MRRLRIISLIKESLRQAAPDLQIILYGSEARGEARADSDIDLLLLVNKDPVTLQDKVNLTDPLYDIELEIGVQINPIVESAGKWGKVVTPFYENVVKDGIVL